MSGEHIVRGIKISRRAVLTRMTLSIVLNILITIGFVSLQQSGASLVVAVIFMLFVKAITGMSGFEWLASAVMGLVTAPIAAVIRLVGNERAISNTRILHKEGIISVSFWDTTIERIKKATFTQSVLGRIMKYGNVEVTDVFDQVHELTFVDNPADITRILNEVAGRKSFTQVTQSEALLPGEQPNVTQPQITEQVIVAEKLLGDGTAGAAIVAEQVVSAGTTTVDQKISAEKPKPEIA